MEQRQHVGLTSSLKTEITPKTKLELSVQIDVLADGLVEELEFEPFISYYTTWGFGRVQKRIELVPIGSELVPNLFGDEEGRTATVYTSGTTLESDPIPDNPRGDESMWIYLRSNTRASGIKELDEEESEYVTRTMQSGSCQLQVRELLTAIVKQNQVTDAFEAILYKNVMDPRIYAYVNAKSNDETASNKLSHKAFLRARITCKHPTTGKDVASMLETFDDRANLQATSGTGMTAQTRIPYTPNNFRMLLDPMENLGRHYLSELVSIPGRKEPRYAATNDDISKLLLFAYGSQQGNIPVIGFWSHDPYTRTYLSKEQRDLELKIYGYNADTERYMRAQLQAALNRHGLDEETYEATVNEQLQRKDDNLSGLFLTCLQATINVGTFISNCVYYAADMRAVRVKFGDKLMMLESFDTGALGGVSVRSDCEDSQNVASTVCRILKSGRWDLKNRWESSALECARRLLGQLTFLNVGALVTSAFVGSDGEKIKKRDLKDLPKIGSKEDEATENGGHCHGIASSNANALKYIGDSKVSALPEWQLKQPSLVLEGTGPVEPFVLPADEVYAKHPIQLAKAKARREFLDSFMKSLKENTSIVGVMKPEGRPFYFSEPTHTRRVSTFYKIIGQATSMDMYASDCGKSQLAFCNKKTDKWGLNISEFLRDSMSGTAETNFKFVFPYEGKEEYWKTKVLPLMESLQNQMPVMAMGRFSHDQLANTHSKRISEHELLTLGYNNGLVEKATTEKAQKHDKQHGEAKVDTLGLVIAITGSGSSASISDEDRETYDRRRILFLQKKKKVDVLPMKQLHKRPVLHRPMTALLVLAHENISSLQQTIATDKREIAVNRVTLTSKNRVSNRKELLRRTRFPSIFVLPKKMQAESRYSGIKHGILSVYSKDRGFFKRRDLFGPKITSRELEAKASFSMEFYNALTGMQEEHFYAFRGLTKQPVGTVNVWYSTSNASTKHVPMVAIGFRKPVEGDSYLDAVATDIYIVYKSVDEDDVKTGSKKLTKVHSEHVLRTSILTAEERFLSASIRNGLENVLADGFLDIGLEPPLDNQHGVVSMMMPLESGPVSRQVQVPITSVNFHMRRWITADQEPTVQNFGLPPDFMIDVYTTKGTSTVTKRDLVGVSSTKKPMFTKHGLVKLEFGGYVWDIDLYLKYFDNSETNQQKKERLDRLRESRLFYASSSERIGGVVALLFSGRGPDATLTHVINMGLSSSSAFIDFDFLRRFSATAFVDDFVAATEALIVANPFPIRSKVVSFVTEHFEDVAGGCCGKEDDPMTCNIIASAALSVDKTIQRFYTRPWQVKTVEVAREMISTLRSLKNRGTIEAYAFYSEKPFPQIEPMIVTLVCINCKT